MTAEKRGSVGKWASHGWQALRLTPSMAETASGVQIQTLLSQQEPGISAVAQPPPERMHKAIHHSAGGSTLEWHGEALLKNK